MEAALHSAASMDATTEFTDDVNAPTNETFGGVAEEAVAMEAVVSWLPFGLSLPHMMSSICR